MGRYKKINPDDEQEMNIVVRKMLDLMISENIDKNCACTAMLHLICFMLTDAGAVEVYSNEMYDIWKMYQMDRERIYD